MWKTTEGSTGRLIQLCVGYFVCYVVTGVTAKWFLRIGGLAGMEFTTYSTIGSFLVTLGVAIGLGWWRLESARKVPFGGMSVPHEIFYIIPSGICTAVVIPTTTLMYMLPISVMVAMVIMRASVIVTSRVIDSIQIHQGILKKQVYWEENVGVVFALAAASVHLLVARGKDFNFVTNAAAMTIFLAYISSYAVRLYIMNYYKNTRPKGIRQDNKGFFAVEQVAACSALFVVVGIILLCHKSFGWSPEPVRLMSDSMFSPHPLWLWASLAGGAFGVAAFFSVFLFMFKGRTATFAGLVNRLTSLIAGTTATLTFWLIFDGKQPKARDWISLGFILVAVAFLTLAERKRSKELLAAKEIVETPEEEESAAASASA